MSDLQKKIDSAVSVLRQFAPVDDTLDQIMWDMMHS